MCGGYDDRSLGERRCHGYQEGDWVHCRRADLSPNIQYSEASDTYAHLWTDKPCFCGQVHQPSAAPSTTTPQLRLVARWKYYDLNGNLDTEVRRYQRADGSKDYRQYHPDPTGEMKPGAGPVQYLLYRYNELKDLPKDRAWLLVEGEKAVDSCIARGIPATCNIGGAGKWHDSYTALLAGRKLIIIPDNDPEVDERGKEHRKGQKHAQMVFDKLKGVADLKLMPPMPDVGEKGDIADWWEAGKTVDDLYNWVKTVEWVNRPRHRYHESELELLPPIEWLLRPFIQDRAINMVSGPSGSGKSYVALHWAKELGRRYNVLYLAAEDASQYPERVKAWNIYNRFEAKEGHFYLETLPINLINPQDADRLIAENDDIKPRFVVIDTYAAATPGSNENDNGQIELILGNARKFIAAWGCAVLVVHHFNKAETAERGGSALRAGIVQTMQVTLDQDTLKLTMDKTRNAEKTEDVFFKFEKVAIPVKLSDGTTEIRTQRVPVQTDHAETDFTTITPAQMAILKYMGALIRRDNEHRKVDIEQATNQPTRTVGDSMAKLITMKLVVQPKERGPYRITEQGLVAGGYIPNDLKLVIQEVKNW